MPSPRTLFAAGALFALTASAQMSVAQAVASVKTGYVPSAVRAAAANAVDEAPVAVTRLMPVYAGGVDVLVEAIAAGLAYPAIAQANGIEGTVVLRVRVDEEGRASVSQVIEGLTPQCDAAAVAAVEALDGFSPALLGGRAFARSVRIAVRFSL